MCKSCFFSGDLYLLSEFFPQFGLSATTSRFTDSKDANEWTPECTKAFKASKNLILSAKVLSHSDPMLPLKLAADTSAYGLGAVI